MRIHPALMTCSLLAAAALWVDGAHGQTTGGGSGAQGSVDIAIESEMLTYRALQSNTDAIACDIAGYLSGSDHIFQDLKPHTVCNVKAIKNQTTVVLLPFDSSEIQDFQVWRADMATMTRLHHRAQQDCPSLAEAGGRGAAAAKSAAPAATTAKPASLAATLLAASPPLAIAQSILGLLVTNASTEQVSGTIHDQAFMNGIARELGELNVPVLMPTVYTPYGLTAMEESNSPFLTSLYRVLDDRRACTNDESNASGTPSKKGAAVAGDSNVRDIQRSIADIDAFLSTLTGEAALASTGTPAPASAPAPATAKAASGGAPAPKGGGGNPGAAPTAPAAAPGAPAASAPKTQSHLNAVLLADGLAAKLGADLETGALPPETRTNVHLLFIQALESGGSISRYSNWLGTKIQFSGGSVGTYALFTVDGIVECSGNVYEYGGLKDAKDFEKTQRTFTPDPAQQMVFLRHSCRPHTVTQ